VRKNAIMVIYPHRLHGTWVFDDKTTGLVQEPFVAGIPEIIDRAVAGIPGAADGFKLTISATPFPGYQIALDWARQEYDGNWYRVEGTDAEGWLCPALLKYFDAASKRIYCAVAKKGS
jgi:hypothetical protein